METKLNRREAIKIASSAALAPWLASTDLRAGSRVSGSPGGGRRISLDRAVVLIGRGEPSYLQFAAADLANYLKEITGTAVAAGEAPGPENATRIILGEAMARRLAPAAAIPRDASEESYLLECSADRPRAQVIVAGQNPHGTNAGVATLMKLIRAEGNSASLEAPLRLQQRPSFARRGMHLNGWPFRPPYSFRGWSERDWQRYIDLIWLQGANLLLMLSFIEIMPVPLSPEDEAALQELRRIVAYAQEQRGMKVWIMHAANRVAVSDCGVRDPKNRPYWVNDCQVDLDPADPRKFEKIVASLAALYRTVNNADAFLMIDSDPGGWPQSPLREQIRIFTTARKLLDRYNVHGREAKLIDWMWLGWGRHKHFDATQTVVSSYDWGPQNPDASDVAFMEKTIGAFQAGVPEPWGLVAGFGAYLQSCREKGVLGKTVFLPYGAIEYEPAAPWTNVALAPVRGSFETAAQYPGLLGMMGNAQTPLVQLPRTYGFLAMACDAAYRRRSDREVLAELAGHLYPEQSALIEEAYLALDATGVEQIRAVLSRLQSALRAGRLGRPGVLGRKLFPDHREVAKSLVYQLKIRAARQELLRTLHASPSKAECQRLVQDYFDALLAWNQETGWQRMIKLGVWAQPLYQQDAEFRGSLTALKRAIRGSAPATSYAQIDQFFSAISQTLLQKYDLDSVMETCIEPLKLAVIQAP